MLSELDSERVLGRCCPDDDVVVIVDDSFFVSLSRDRLCFCGLAVTTSELSFSLSSPPPPPPPPTGTFSPLFSCIALAGGVVDVPLDPRGRFVPISTVELEVEEEE